MKTYCLVGAALAALLLSPASVSGADDEAGIQWFGTWTAAKAEAKRTERPILLVSAAPHCRNVSGIW